jgi:hypothetical protein
MAESSDGGGREELINELERVRQQCLTLLAINEGLQAKLLLAKEQAAENEASNSPCRWLQSISPFQLHPT